MDDFEKPVKRNKLTAARRNGLIILLLVVLIAALVVADVLKPAKASNPVSLGYVSEPQAYCVYDLKMSQNADYTVSAYDNYDGMISRLKSGDLDAALLPARYLSQAQDGSCTVVAVTSFLNLVAVENGGTVYSIADLCQRQIVAPESLRGTLEWQMLNTLLSNAQVSVDVQFISDEAVEQKAQDGDFDIMLLPVNRCADVLLQNDYYRSCFDLADQWSVLTGTQAPAGGCLVVRNEVFSKKNEALSDVLSGFKASIGFLQSRHKKAATLVAASGFNTDYDNLWRTIPHCMFEYLDGDAMAESLAQLQKLNPAG